MPRVLGIRFAGRREVVGRAPCATADEFVRRPRHTVGARPREHVHLPGGIASEGRVVGGGGDLELLNAVDRGPHRRRVQLRVDVVHPVEDVAVEVLARAVAREGELAAHRAGRSLRRRIGAGRQQGQLEEVAAIERQVADLIGIDARGSGGRRALHHGNRGVRADRGHGRRCCHGKLRLQPQVLPDGELGTVPVGRETWDLRLDGVHRRAQLREGEAAAGVRGRLTRFAGVLARDSNLHIRQGGASLIDHDAADGRSRRL